MKQEQIKKALEGSISKWDAIVESPEAMDEGADNCPLCQLFDSVYGDCRNSGGMCIVVKAVGVTGCRKTPYVKWLSHQKRAHLFDSSPDWHRIAGCKTCLKLSKEELEFLKSLRKNLKLRKRKT